MKPPHRALQDFIEPLLRAASAEHVLPHWAQVARATKPDGSLVTAADTAMQAHIERALLAQFPADGFLGEEMLEPEQQRMLARGRFWCLDPVDGTSNFASGLPFFSVSLALIDGGRAVAGFVYDPLRQECFSAFLHDGAYLNGQPLTAPPQARPLRQCVAVVDFKRIYGSLTARLALDPPYGSQRNLGSCALEWCWLAAGRFQLYLHGGQKLWDYAAGHLVLAESGGHATTIEGESVFTQRLVPRSVVAALDPELFAGWRAWLDLRR